MLLTTELAREEAAVLIFASHSVAVLQQRYLTTRTSRHAGCILQSHVPPASL
jgi:hypothetical protein